jgi:hypothetical protein
MMINVQLEDEYLDHHVVEHDEEEEDVEELRELRKT